MYRILFSTNSNQEVAVSSQRINRDALRNVFSFQKGTEKKKMHHCIKVTTNKWQIKKTNRSNGVKRKKGSRKRRRGCEYVYDTLQPPSNLNKKKKIIFFFSSSPAIQITLLDWRMQTKLNISESRSVDSANKQTRQQTKHKYIHIDRGRVNWLAQFWNYRAHVNSIHQKM